MWSTKPFYQLAIGVRSRPWRGLGNEASERSVVQGHRRPLHGHRRRITTVSKSFEDFNTIDWLDHHKRFHTYKVHLAYDGTKYAGWQFQPRIQTVQGKVEAALTQCTQISREQLGVMGAGRTDSGVHASDQVFHFYTEKPLCLERTFASLNGMLPFDIRVKTITEVPRDFHARFSSLGKIYHYRINTDPVMDPFTRHYRYFMRWPMDEALVRQGCEQFIGEHDFSAYANKTSDKDKKRNPIRRVDRFDVVPIDGGLQLEVQGPGFLYKQAIPLAGGLVIMGQDMSHIMGYWHLVVNGDGHWNALDDGMWLSLWYPSDGYCLFEGVRDSSAAGSIYVQCLGAFSPAGGLVIDSHVMGYWHLVVNGDCHWSALDNGMWLSLWYPSDGYCLFEGVGDSSAARCLGVSWIRLTLAPSPCSVLMVITCAGGLVFFDPDVRYWRIAVNGDGRRMEVGFGRRLSLWCHSGGHCLLESSVDSSAFAARRGRGW
ncbi:hypothetical protein CYMTET_9424 [Cymbomonas tetramitiformis]|uniref:tRNA pseudouridine synthase n=1 Tax=Cymbomonas tetramitiformis TaxID=36881 RepID=A0AAE0LF52_9CHLO|nr:hypothetical protein CYMTET_9424 [Cymbomonas tetramitiformis]